MAFPVREALQATGRYLRQQPATLPSLLRRAAGMEIAIPLDAFRWLASHLLTGKKAPRDVVISARPPALCLEATTRLMGQNMRVACAITVEELRAGPGELRLAIRVRDLKLDPEDPNSPLKMLLDSGALDLTKPAGLFDMMGKRPAAMVEADGDRFVLDLLLIPALGQNPLVQRALGLVSPVLGVSGIRTDGDLLVISLRASPRGLPRSLAALRRA